MASLRSAVSLAATQAVVDGNGKGAVMRLVDMSVGQCAGNAGRRTAMDAL